MHANTTTGFGGTARRARRLDTTTLALIGLLGPIAFMAVALILPAFSEYSLLADPISALACGRYGAVQTLSFIVAGLSTFALAVGLRRTLPDRRATRGGIGLVALWGVCLLLDALFPLDPPGTGRPQSIPGTIHLIAALVAFLAILVAIGILSFAFRRSPGWRAFAPWSCALGVVAVATFFLPSEADRAGLYQRLFVGAIMLWLALVARQLGHGARRADGDDPRAV